jgi:hypothetical protein
VVPSRRATARPALSCECWKDAFGAPGVCWSVGASLSGRYAGRSMIVVKNAPAFAAVDPS